MHQCQHSGGVTAAGLPTFEICMPSALDTAFLPRFTEFCNSACEARLATNNCGRDLTVDNNGCVSGNLIIAICVTCEKKSSCRFSSASFHRIRPGSCAAERYLHHLPSPLFPNQIRPRIRRKTAEAQAASRTTAVIATAMKAGQRRLRQTGSSRQAGRPRQT
ncbi:MAG: hypothetical protein ACLTK0_08365 [Anaerovoracaceae bacterium]